MGYRERAAALAIVARLLGCARADVVRPPDAPAPDSTTLAADHSLRSGLRAGDLRGLQDPTVRGARVFPGSLEAAQRWGAEPGGGSRAIVSGIRVVSWPGGAVAAAADRLPASPSDVVALPERLGGGFVFAIGQRLWRAATWLEPAAPVFTSSSPIAGVSVGLDRLYVRSPQGFLAALDPRTGAALGLGPVPPSPRVAQIAALDAWHAIALADLLGVALTSDAGASWRPIALPIEADDVTAAGGTFSVTGLDPRRERRVWRVSPDGGASWVAAPPLAPSAPARAIDPVARVFGERPLVAALEDGWPLADGTALVARDGALARVRLADGALVEAAGGAFPLVPARCHAISLARTADPGAFGFVCGEPRGPTAVYAWDAGGSRLVELRRFEDPREVLAFGNGALAARGGCGPTRAATGGDGEGRAPDEAWCLRAPGGAWTEARFRGEGIAGARLVVLADGRSALIRPPAAGDPSSARLTIVDGVRAAQHPLRWPPQRREVARALRWGTWLDGFEERRPGVLGGWIDVAGSILGVEVALDGEVRVGEYVRDAGAPVAASRWALGWTASGAGFETTDGGMTWAKEIDLPPPIAGVGAGRERACGPAGCVLAGWLRVGWGGPGHVEPPVAPPARPLWARRPPNPLELDCDVPAGKPPEHEPSTSSAERSVVADVSAGLDRALRLQPLGRIRAWGWAADGASPGLWQVRWQPPWGGWADARSSAASPAPWPSLDAARRALGGAQAWALAPGDDFDHALLVGSGSILASGGVGPIVIALESDRAPFEVRPRDGGVFPPIEAAARSAGRWYVATAQRPSERAATVLWAVDGAVAQEVARAPRLEFVVRPSLRLARRDDGRAIGIVLEGQPELERGVSLWVTSVDVASGAIGEPERMAALDLSDRTATPCAGDDAGWEVDVPYPVDVDVRVEGRWSASLQRTMARARLLPDRACVERLYGSSGAYAATAPDVFLSPRPLAPPPIGIRALEVSVLSARTRFQLPCRMRAP